MISILILVELKNLFESSPKYTLLANMFTLGGVFVVTFQSNRKELATDIEALKKKVTGAE